MEGLAEQRDKDRFFHAWLIITQLMLKFQFVSKNDTTYLDKLNHEFF